MGGKWLRNNASHFAVEKQPKEKGPEKRGRDPGLQSTEGGRFGHHPVPASLKQRNNGTYTQQEQYNIQQLQWPA